MLTVVKYQISIFKIRPEQHPAGAAFVRKLPGTVFTKSLIFCNLSPTTQQSLKCTQTRNENRTLNKSYYGSCRDSEYE